MNDGKKMLLKNKLVVFFISLFFVLFNTQGQNYYYVYNQYFYNYYYVYIYYGNYEYNDDETASDETPASLGLDISFSGNNVVDLGGGLGANVELAENQQLGTFVELSSFMSDGTEDSDVTYSIDSSAIDAGFSIDSVTGSLSAPNLDFESNILGGNNQIDITVTVTNSEGLLFLKF